MHDMPDRAFKNVCLFNMNQANVWLFERCLQFTGEIKDTRTTPLTSLILNIANIDILNIEQLSHLILVLKGVL